MADGSLGQVPVSAESLDKALQAQREAFAANPYPAAAERRGWLDTLHAVVMDNTDAICRAVSEDFGNRSPHETRLAEIAVGSGAIRHAKRHLPRWMRPERRSVGLKMMPAGARVMYQPLGVVGVIAPWNYPLLMVLQPVAGALAAGNRVMVKPSELTPRTSALMQSLFAEAFKPDLLTVVTGGPEIGEAFSKLPFDHLLFTGSTPVGRKVAAAAADNLTPTTLELGGKSPVVICDDYPRDKAARLTAMGKLLNAGQTCIAPDYALVPPGQASGFADAVVREATAMYPTLTGNADYTSIVADRHHRRLLDLLDDARQKGARLIEVNPAGEAMDNTRKIPPTVVLGATDGMRVMQEEIFGPILPIIEYDDLNGAIARINRGDRPLALYVFTNRGDRRRHVLSKTISGGTGINTTMLHAAIEELPFGGVGASGHGAYHGRTGFRTFSHARAVLHPSRFHMYERMRPPFGAFADWIYRTMLRF